MLPWKTVAEAEAASSTFVLKQRGEEFMVTANGKVLMGSRAHGSEIGMAAEGVKRLRTSNPKVLVGGLGFGFSLRAALDRIGPSSKVLVAELVPAIVEWNRTLLSDLAKKPLDDKRVEVVVGDVRQVMAKRGPFDLILMDVDNGPFAVSTAKNSALYDDAGVGRMAGSLSPSGVLVVWSAGPDERFLKRLEDHGLKASLANAGGRHVLFLGEKPYRQRR